MQSPYHLSFKMYDLLFLQMNPMVMKQRDLTRRSHVAVVKNTDLRRPECANNRLQAAFS
jgi:hypothetical protein